MPWWNCVSEHVWLSALRVNITFNIACKPNSQWLLPLCLSNRLDWANSSTIWLWPLKVSGNYISSYPNDFYFLLHFAQMQSALEAENAASSHLLWHLSSLIMMALPSLLALITMWGDLPDVFRSLSMHHPGAFPMKQHSSVFCINSLFLKGGFFPVARVLDLVDHFVWVLGHPVSQVPETQPP